MENLTFLRNELTHQPSHRRRSVPAELATTPNGRMHVRNSLLQGRRMPIAAPAAMASEVNEQCTEADGWFVWKTRVAGPSFGLQSSRYPVAKMDRVRAQIVPMAFILASQYGRCCRRLCKGYWAGLFRPGSRSSRSSGWASSYESAS